MEYMGDSFKEAKKTTIQNFVNVFHKIFEPVIEPGTFCLLGCHDTNYTIRTYVRNQHNLIFLYNKNVFIPRIVGNEWENDDT